MTRLGARLLLSVILLVAAAVTIGLIASLREPPQSVTERNVEEVISPTAPSTVLPAPSSPPPSPPPPSPAPAPTPAPTPTPTPTPNPTPTPSEISRGNTLKQQVVFTFDAGAGTHSLAAILSTLQAHKLKATFFVTGKWARDNPTGLAQIAAAGHEVFNHTYSHPDLTTVSDGVIVNELQQANTTISGITGKTTKPYFRPPYGARNQHVLNVAWAQGYRSVYWTVDALDWKPGVKAEQVRQRVLTGVAPGTIYLMHIGDDITGQILEGLITSIQSRGYSIVPLSQAF